MLCDLTASAERLALVGLAKNTGKTEVLAALLRELEATGSAGGRDVRRARRRGARRDRLADRQAAGAPGRPQPAREHRQPAELERRPLRGSRADRHPYAARARADRPPEGRRRGRSRRAERRRAGPRGERRDARAGRRAGADRRRHRPPRGISPRCRRRARHVDRRRPRRQIEEIVQVTRRAVELVQAAGAGPPARRPPAGWT